LGLIFFYPKSKAKRDGASKKIIKPVVLKNKLDLFTEIGLKLVKPDSVKKKHEPQTIKKLKDIFLSHKVRLRKTDDLDFMTAYQALGIIYNINEATVRKTLEKGVFKKILKKS
jgi:hypothetical protein